MISPLAYVDPNARIGQNVEIMPFAYIEGDVTIGDNCVIMRTCLSSMVRLLAITTRFTKTP